MDTAELDVALEELETRLERLRALYEQYFMGIEKIEPSIARKDVDRRIYILRREKIRNTAKRFKLQTIIQRYNTFQQYWQRICREIENGTYKRHLLKAQKNGDLLTIAARKRLGRQARTSQPPGASPSSPPEAAQPSPSSRPPASAPPAPAAPPPVVEPAAAARPLGSPPLPRRPAPPTALAPAAPAAAKPSAPAAAAPAPAAAPKPAAPKPFESLDLDMDFMGDWDPSSKVAPAPKAPAAAPKPAAPAVAAKPVPLPGRPASIPPPPVAAPPRPASMRPPSAPARPVARPIPPPKPAAVPPPKPAAPAAAAPPPATLGAAPFKPAALGAAPLKPAALGAAPLKPAGLGAAPRPAAAPPKPAAGGGDDDARMRDLHARLQQAKQQTKEANVSFEGLAKSIRATEAKLREQHKNRKIDFDVVIKDGKAVVKPIVR